MGLLSFAFAGGGFILIGAHEALDATLSNQNQNPPFSSINNNSTPTTHPKQDPQTTAATINNKTSLFSISLSVFSSFFILDSLLSLHDAHSSNDAVGAALQLQSLAVALIFLLYSVLSIFTNSLSLPPKLVTLIGAFAFAEEFLLFYLQRKDPSGVENRYYELLLVPIAACVFSTFLELKRPSPSSLPRLGRGIGLILQGTWFVQMGLSIFSSSWVAQGCSLHKVSRGNYTLRCNGHMDYHRARAIATLQFNCHLALMVVVVVALCSLTSGRNNGGGRGGWNVVDSAASAARYTPIGAELQMFENSASFTLDSEDDDDDEITDGNVAAGEKAVVVEHHGMNGHGSHN